MALMAEEMRHEGGLLLLAAAQFDFDFASYSSFESYLRFE
jgi:hypothetical protein